MLKGFLSTVIYISILDTNKMVAFHEYDKYIDYNINMFFSG